MLYNSNAIVIGNFEPGQSRDTAALRNQLCAVVFFLPFRKFNSFMMFNNKWEVKRINYL